MAKHRLPTGDESQMIANLEGRLGSQQLRTLLASENVGAAHPERSRIVSPRRMERWLSGGGRLSEEEAARLRLIAKNARNIEGLTKRGEKKSLNPTRTNRAIRTWLFHGKEKDAKRRKDEDELRAIRALRMLGVDIDLGTYYIKGVTA